MKIKQIYSHLNGEEFLIVHKPDLWNEIQRAITNVDAEKAFVKISKEKNRTGEVLYSPSKLNKLFKDEFSKREKAKSS